MGRTPPMKDVVRSLLLAGVLGSVGLAARGLRRPGPDGGPESASEIPPALGRWTRTVAFSRRCVPQLPLYGPLVFLALLVAWSFSPWRPRSNSVRDLVLLAGGGVAMVAWSVFVIWQVPKRQARIRGKDPVDPKDLFQIENAARGTLAQIVVSLFGLLGFAFTWLQLADSRAATGRTLEMNHRGQIATRFAQAVDQLGELETLDVRLGGVYQLERIANDEPEEYWRPVVEVLTGYLKGHMPWQEPALGQTPVPRAAVPADVQAILVVLGRLPAPPADGAAEAHLPRDGTPSPGERLVNLSGTDLRNLSLSTRLRLPGVDLTGVHLEGARLPRADLSDANLSDAYLTGAFLENADLEGATLARARLQGANLIRITLTRATLDSANLTGIALLDYARLDHASLLYANLEGASLLRAELPNAVLRRAELDRATLTGANLAGADLTFADLTFAKLAGADLTGAKLDGANLTGAELEAAIGLTQQQLNDACVTEAAVPPKLPPGLTPPSAIGAGACATPSSTGLTGPEVSPVPETDADASLPVPDAPPASGTTPTATPAAASAPAMAPLLGGAPTSVPGATTRPRVPVDPPATGTATGSTSSTPGSARTT